MYIYLTDLLINRAETCQRDLLFPKKLSMSGSDVTYGLKISPNVRKFEQKMTFCKKQQCDIFQKYVGFKVQKFPAKIGVNCSIGSPRLQVRTCLRPSFLLRALGPLHGDHDVRLPREHHVAQLLPGVDLMNRFRPKFTDKT
jgi:hypothetical protein